MMKKVLLLVLIVIGVLPGVFADPFAVGPPIVFWNTVCSNQYQDTAPSASSFTPTVVSPVVTGTPATVTATVSTPSSVAVPTATFGSTNCQSVVSRQIRWENQVTSTGTSDQIVVNTPQETLAVVNRDDSDTSVLEVRWYDQEGLVPSGLTAPELRVDYSTGLGSAAHAAVSDGANMGDMMLAVVDSNADLHVERLRATTTPIVCQAAFADTLTGINFVDYNNGRFAVLASVSGSADVILYVLDSSCMLINRVAIDSGVSAEFGTGIRLDSAGNAYVSFKRGAPAGNPYVVKLPASTSYSTVAWTTQLHTGTHTGVAFSDNAVALVDGSVYSPAEITGGSAHIYRLSQATGTADFQLDLGSTFDLEGIIKKTSAPDTGIYYYGALGGTGAAGDIDDDSNDGAAGGSVVSVCAASYPAFAGGRVNGFADGGSASGAANFIAGRTGVNTGTHGIDSMGQFISKSCTSFGPSNGYESGVETDIGNLFAFDEYYDVVTRPSPGFLNFFTVVGNSITSVEQFNFGAACFDGQVDSLFETCDPGAADGHQEGPGVACTQGVCQSCNCCGDGLVAFNEQCDDGNNINGDGCSSTCTLEGNVCGDGVPVNPPEECDDGNSIPNDGCENDCTISSFCPDGCAGQGGNCVIDADCCSGFACTEGTCF